MRQLRWIFLIMITLVIGNFSLWFWHTRTIITGLENLRYELRTLGVKMTYEEIKFTNFKAWQLYAKINGIVFQDVQNRAYIKLGEVQLISLPFDKELKAIADPNWEMHPNLNSEAALMHFATAPELNIKFKKSMRDFNNEVKWEMHGQSRRNGVLGTMKHLILKMGAMEARTNSATVMSWKESTLELKARQEPEKLIRESTWHAKDYRSNLSEYFAEFGPSVQQKADELSKQLGPTEFRLTLQNIKTLSEDTQAALKQRLGEDVDLDKIDAKYDAEYNEYDLAIIEEKFDVKIHRTLPIFGNTPKSKWLVDIHGYNAFTSYVISAFNLILERIAFESQQPPVLVSPEQSSEIKKLLQDFTSGDDSISMEWKPFANENDSDKVANAFNKLAALLNPNIHELLHNLRIITTLRRQKEQVGSPQGAQ